MQPSSRSEDFEARMRMEAELGSCARDLTFVELNLVWLLATKMRNRPRDKGWRRTQVMLEQIREDTVKASAA